VPFSQITTVPRNASGPCNSNDIPRLDHGATQPAIALAQLVMGSSQSPRITSVGFADVCCLPYPSITGSTLSLTGQSFRFHVCRGDIIVTVHNWNYLRVAQTCECICRMKEHKQYAEVQTSNQPAYGFPDGRCVALLYWSGWNRGVLSRTDSQPIICSMNRKGWFTTRLVLERLVPFSCVKLAESMYS
jgi:hypothetical protein